jgi:hypothetical protein
MDVLERTFCREGRYVEGSFVDGRFVEGRFVDGRWTDVSWKDVLWKDVLYYHSYFSWLKINHMLTVNISAFILELGADLNNPQFQHTGEGGKEITYHHDC